MTLVRSGLQGFARVFLIGACFGHAICFGQAPKFTISTVAGVGTSGFTGDGGQATAANLAFPAAIAFDSAGNMYIADASNSRIRRDCIVLLDGFDLRRAGGVSH